MHKVTHERLSNIILIGACVAFRLPAAAQPPCATPVSICALFEDLRSHEGKMVAVRGNIYSSREIFAIGETGCKSKFITKYNLLPTIPSLDLTKDFAWPTALDLADAEDIVRGEEKVPFTTDRESITRLGDTVRHEKERLGTTNVEVSAVMTGLLRLRQQYEVGAFNDGTMHGRGYGHLGIYPGQLVIQKVCEATVRPGKPPPIKTNIDHAPR